MSPDDDKLYLRQSAWLLVGAIAMQCLHYLALDHFHLLPEYEGLWKVVAHLPRELSIAFLIAAVLNYFVEKNTRRHHEALQREVLKELSENADTLNRDIRKNLLRTVFEQNLGEHVVAQIEAKLFEPKPYRTEAEAVYSIEMLEGIDGKHFVRISSDLRYVAFNPSRHPATSLPIGIETTAPAELAEHLKLVSIKCDGADAMKQTIAADCKKGGTLKYFDDNGYTLPSKQSKTIQVCSVRADHMEASETYVTAVPAEVLRMTLQHPPELGVEVMSLHPDDVETVTSTPTTKIWRVHGLLAGQGISFWWSPVSQTSAVVASKPSDGAIKASSPAVVAQA